MNTDEKLLKLYNNHEHIIYGYLNTISFAID